MDQPCIGHRVKVSIGRAHGHVISFTTQGQSEEIGHAGGCRRIGNHGLQGSGFSIKDENRTGIDTGGIVSRCADDDGLREKSHGFSEVIAFLGFRGFQRAEEVASIRIEIHHSGVRLRGPSSQRTDDQQLRIACQRPSKILVRLRIRRFEDTLQPSAFPVEEKHLSMISRVRAGKRGTHRKQGGQKRHRMPEPIRTAVFRTWRGKGPADLPIGHVNQIGFPHLKLRGSTRPGISNGHQQIPGSHGMPKSRRCLIGTDDDLSQCSRLPVEDRDRAHRSTQRPFPPGSADDHVVRGKAHGQAE